MVTGPDTWAEPTGPGAWTPADLVDLLDRVVERGVVISGEVVIALAGIDLVRLDLRALLVGVIAGRPVVPP